jgi:hypothetical protein
VCLTVRKHMTLCVQKLKMHCTHKSDAAPVCTKEGHVQTYSTLPLEQKQRPYALWFDIKKIMLAIFGTKISNITSVPMFCLSVIFSFCIFVSIANVWFQEYQQILLFIIINACIFVKLRGISTVVQYLNLITRNLLQALATSTGYPEGAFHCINSYYR